MPSNMEIRSDGPLNHMGTIRRRNMAPSATKEAEEEHEPPNETLHLYEWPRA